jgi:hypothetical protein
LPRGLRLLYSPATAGAQMATDMVRASPITGRCGLR